MTSMHLFQIERFKTDFQHILELQTQIVDKREFMHAKLVDLKELYGQLVKQNNKKIFLFCLDSFYFQYKTLAVELDNIQRSITMINNRIYGDYYKLYHLILIEMSPQDPDIQNMLQSFKKYTPYKDLDPFHEYKTDEFVEIHKDILRVLNHVYTRFLKKEQVIVNYSEYITKGMSVGNFMQTLSYENTLLKEQLMLHASYLTFFHTSQTGYLAKLLTRVHSFQEELEENILCNQGQVHTKETVDSSSLSHHLQNMAEANKIEIATTLANLENEKMTETIHTENQMEHVVAILSENASNDASEIVVEVLDALVEKVNIETESPPNKPSELSIEINSAPVEALSHDNHNEN